ncbi:hypothetical protein GQX73_g7969 [Xylaria multiplex]|uniref:Carrier domain-containing protein n=1 Tax=Xylaria multiplex TaxID=323545 RepID=A0A7C8IK03_9PEZI|nr:hypothetical protein GQX73_g7969 [Xylaria multiplex]
MECAPAYGRRLMPTVLDDLAARSPARVYAAIPKTNDVKDGFRDITVADVARMVNFIAWWVEGRFGKSDKFEAIGYIGIADVRGPILFQGLIKSGFKILLLSPRNTASTNISLMMQTGCSKLLYASELSPLIDPMRASSLSLCTVAIPSFEDMVASTPKHYPYQKLFEDAQDEPAAVLHSSGSTRLPKPIIMTHASFAVLDNEHNLPEVIGRKRRDWTMWSFEGGGRLFTVFPFFHLGGFLMFTVAAIFGKTTIVYAPPFLVPDGTLIRDIMLQQRLNALLLPPSLVEQLINEPQGMELVKKLDFVAYSGAPLSSAIGNRLSKIIDVFSPYGATETYPQPELATSPEDWEWHEFSPHCKHEMQLFDPEEGTYELVIMSGESSKNTAAVYHNLPHSRGQFHTKDLFIRNAEKPNLFKYYGRKDDIITLSNGEKFNPIPFELRIQGDSSIKGALVIGNGRSQPALLLEPKSSEQPSLEDLWPLIEKSNTLVPGQGRIHRGMIILGCPDKPFARTGKGTIIRRLTEDAYRSEIEKLYVDMHSSNVYDLQADAQTLSYDRVTISKFLRSILTAGFPAGVSIDEDQDFYSVGLDSVQTTILVSSLKRNLKGHTTASCDWITPRTIFKNPTIHALCELFYEFLNEGTIPKHNDENEDVVPKYLAALTSTSKPAGTREPRTLTTVAIVGSTGFLGPEIIRSLLMDSSIIRIYCLNRSKDAKERTLTQLNSESFTPLLHKLEYLTIELGKPRLGLPDDDHNKLAAELDAIVFNAWRPDFNLTVHSFHPFLHALVEVIKISATSVRSPRILFVSSLSSVGSLASNSTVPEALVDDPAAATSMGYAQSKLAAERVLAAACRRYGISVLVARVCQLVGASARSDGSWLSAVVTTSKTLNLIPSHVAVVDWVRVSDAAKMLYDFLKAPGGEGEALFYHITHPKQQSWDIIVDTLRKRLNGASVVPLRQWIGRLKEIEHPSRDKLPAAVMLDFFESLAEGGEKLTYDTQRASGASSVSLARIDVKFIEAWLGE